MSWKLRWFANSSGRFDHRV